MSIVLQPQILEPGTFSVRSHRKNIPDRVKLAVLIRQKGASSDGIPFTVEDAIENGIQFDHDPRLESRRFDVDADDFVPPQHDHTLIFAKRLPQHAEKTFGRKEGAEKTVTTRGSDIGESNRIKRGTNKQLLHQAALARKGGDRNQEAALLAQVTDKNLKRKYERKHP